ncbi:MULTISPECIES: tripartite tricarboxylate transporter substrate binding protein BugD [unclassified Chelatococcus]|uniref:tripartite tricarboxylate transporter substrate binding protein BugD n=1 Tax=unclassified Chelatococcus TaxID=2638111 RepID=UPI001BCC4E11|nr:MULTISPECIES: tripartite tricarboxylate transporter substrate binding protein BugD [unclassified Chelatococcus]CAH1649992.1 Tripartite-type tricarboxylate transporter receptor subunit TctC [Hyphomicrobiales bacterium]MBS7739676.1 tripartite tricarboxylate transporter substrate binding protein BugD [Chelatococcus sp. HY11]MBX3544045.1 tripartite tricarboxylate transporter substrate binding protein BugD [Chelatococcus sp.]MCO5075787.1 tripartite tricarboxylate transporter substrate binding pro
MNKTISRRLVTGLAAAATVAAGLGLSLVSAAAAYPDRPITMIVPFAAGGPTDVIARIVAENMSKTLGQQIIVENVAGAGGTTGSTRAAQAAPDGYTLVMGHMGTHGAAPALYPNLKYDPAKDFAPVGLAAGTPILIVAKKDFPAKDLKEFVAYVKANADKVNQAHAGVGSVSHSTCTLLDAQLGIKPTLVPYGGTGPALNDLVSGQVDFMCDQIVNLVPQIQAGTIKAYAVATPDRSPSLPDVPTTKEAGLPEYQVSAWNAIFAPKGTPEDVIAKLNNALVVALDDENTRKRLLDLGGVIADKPGRSPQALQDLVVSEVARWTPVLKGANAK